MVRGHVSAQHVIAGSSYELYTRLVSSSSFQCYPVRCRCAWPMLSIRPRFFIESPCPGVFVCAVVSLSQVDVVVNVLYLSGVDIYFFQQFVLYALYL